MGHRRRSHRLARPAAVLLPVLLAASAVPVRSADIDIYGAAGKGGAPNVMFLLDNTSNWSSNNQNWNANDSWTRCKNLEDPALSTCKALIEAIYYAGVPSSKKRPWENGFKVNSDNIELTQGQVQLRSLKLVLNELVCTGKTDKLDVNVGISMIGTSGSVQNNGHATGYVHFAIQELTGTAASGSCKALIDRLNEIDAKITQPTYKAPSNANYGAAMYEIFKYFGGYTNPDRAPLPEPNGATPVGATGYGPIRYSNLNSLDDPAAFTSAARTTYQSPITAANNCANNYIVLVGNTYPNSEPNNGGPTIFSPSNLGYTPPTLSPVSSDTSRYADEWAYFLANTDVSDQPGVQRVFTYTINTFKDKPDTDQTKLMRSMASVGGIGGAGYFEVGGDLVALINGFREIFVNIAAVNSVFTATTLPVSTTTQGTYLNQLFVGMFRPSANPRWLGNMKQYQLGFVNGELNVVDAKGKSALIGSTGFFSPLAESFWTEDSVFFSQLPSGTPPSASDRPDGAIVEKGGAAQMLRKNNLQSAANRKVYTLPSTAPTSGYSLANKPFASTNGDVTAVFDAPTIAWIRGEANVTDGAGKEDFVGSYMDGTTLKQLGTTGARHSIHGDVLHSRPVALNYGGSDVVVYYGANDGFFRAVDGQKTGSTAGQELWSFIAPEHYDLFKRLRAGTPAVFLPETNSSGGTETPPDSDVAVRSYGMDGPIGVYARYASNGASVTEALIFPAMRRGGRTVYAFDVTSKTDPKFLWKITGGSGDYSKLAQTWSTPKPVVLKSSGAQPPVLLFMGGGYDPKEDQNDSGGIGNVVYVINARTGQRIAALETEYSVPSDVTVVDTNYDGVLDRAYVADVRGNLYRIDFPASGDLTTSDAWDDAKAVPIAKLGGKVFYAPDVVVTSKYIAVSVGTGDREKPLLNSTGDNFFLVKDNLLAPRGSVITKDDLTRVARIDNTSMLPTDIVSPVNDPEGCYLQLASNGEKVVNAPLTIAGVTYFSTNRPAASKNVCTASLGEAYAYQFPLFCGAPRVTPLAGGGLPPSPVGGIVELTVDGQPQKVPFIIGGGKGGKPGEADKPNIPVPPIRTRLNWRIDNTNR